MRKFVLDLTIFFIFLYFFGLGIEFFINFRLEKKRYSFQGDWHDLSGHNSDVLFLGNSRTWVHINPFKMHEKTNLNVEIIAQDGQDAEIIYYKLKEYLKCNNRPKAIVLQFDANFWASTKSLYGFENYSPYFFFLRFKEFTRKLKYRNGYNVLYHVIPLFAFKQNNESQRYLKNIILGEKISINENWEITKGYIGQNRKSVFVKLKESYTIDFSNYNTYNDSFFSLASKNNIRIIGIFTPLSKIAYNKIKNPEIFLNTFNEKKALFRTTGDYFNYNTLDLCSDTHFFYNHQHLNKKGSDSFMNILLGDTNFINEFK